MKPLSKIIAVPILTGILYLFFWVNTLMVFVCFATSLVIVELWQIEINTRKPKQDV